MAAGAPASLLADRRTHSSTPPPHPGPLLPATPCHLGNTPGRNLSWLPRPGGKGQRPAHPERVGDTGHS